ncbi:MAG: hypothetical protein ACRD8O_20210, partial [Bryobacteraceae bacterium]
LLMEEAAAPVRRDGAVVWERRTTEATRFYGLGDRPDPAVNLRGKRVEALRALLISSAGFGEFHSASAKYTFELNDRYRVEGNGASEVDDYFFYGPTPKEILEQYMLVTGPIARLSPADYQVPAREIRNDATKQPAPAKPSWDALAESVRRLINGGISATILPVFDLGPWRDAPEPLRTRAMQVASVTPIVAGGALRNTIRNRLGFYFVTYGEEARDRGFPFIRAMPMQYSRDAEAANSADQFMFGDELLAAPMLGPSNRRMVYLPMGIWTNLKTNEIHKGRQTIAVEAGPDELPLFSRNGAIVPLGQSPTELHYFPKLGGEFFLFESDLLEYSQVHASPAGVFYRFEIESKKDREYEWVVHHFDRPAGVAVGSREYTRVNSRVQLRPGTWYYDAALKNFHLRARVVAGEDHIANVRF